MVLLDLTGSMKICVHKETPVREKRPGSGACEWPIVGVYGGGVMCVVARSCYDVMQIEMYGGRQSASLLTGVPCQPVTVPTTK